MPSPRPDGDSMDLTLEQRLAALEAAVQALAEALRSEAAAAAASPDADADPPNPIRRLLDPHVPAGERIAVVAQPGAPVLEALLGRPGVSLVPEPEGGPAAVARLEALRAQGVRFLLLSVAGREELKRDVLLAEHFAAHFRPIAEDVEVGVTMYEQSVATGRPPALNVLVDDVGAGDRGAPLLDWTGLDMGRLLPGRTIFPPVAAPGERLPYRDHTIDVVLVDDAGRMDEAERVAARAVVRVAPNEIDGATVVETRRLRSDGSAAPPVPILVGTEPGDVWLRTLAEIVGDRRSIEIRAAPRADAAALETESPIVVLAERGVLPLPGCIEAAERLLAQEERLGGVAVKLFAAGGRLEAAGGAAFADGSVEGIAGGAAAAASWHEYVRPVDAAVGLVVLRSAAARQSAAADDGGAFDLASLSAHLWSGGWELCYQPDAAAVRALPRAAGPAGVWPQAAADRPPRPAELGEGFWRSLIARREVGAPG